MYQTTLTYCPEHERLVEVIEESFTKRPRNCLRNAFRYIYEAETIAEHSTAAAGFLVETAKEEAATAVLSLLRTVYGMTRLDLNSHQHKHGVVQFVANISEIVGAHGLTTFTLSIEKVNGVNKLTFTLPLNFDSGESFVMKCHDLEGMTITTTEQQGTFGPLFDKLLAWKEIEDEQTFIKNNKKLVNKKKNNRNKLIYANDGGVILPHISQEVIKALKITITNISLLAFFLKDNVSGYFETYMVPLIEHYCLINNHSPRDIVTKLENLGDTMDTADNKTVYRAAKIIRDMRSTQGI